MITNKKYEAAFNAGYKQGMIAVAEGSKSRAIYERDLYHIYGYMVLALHKRGWKRETIEALMRSIQAEWAEDTQKTEYRYDNGLPIIKIEDRVRDTTGIDMKYVEEMV